MTPKHTVIQRYRADTAPIGCTGFREAVLYKDSNGEAVLFNDLAPLLHELEGLRDREVVLELELEIASRRNSILIEKLANKE